MTQNYRATSPPRFEVSAVPMLQPEYFQLDNGVPVYAINAGTQEVVKIDLIFDAGHVQQQQPLQASFTNKCLIEGTAHYSSNQIANLLDGRGAYLRNFSDLDDARLTLYSLNKHLDYLMPVFSEVALQAVFPVAEVATIIEKSKQEFLVNMEKVRYVSQLHFNRLLFGESHPYDTFRTAEDYDKANTDMLRSFYAAHYATSPFRIIVSGKLQANLQTLLNQYFGKHTPVAAAVVPTASPTHTAASVQYIQRANALQAALRIGKVIVNKHHQDFMGLMVLNTILGGYFGSRLMTNIREDKGYTYGIGSSLVSVQQAGMLVIASEVGDDVQQKAMDEIFIEIEKLRREPVPAGELELVKNYLRGTMLRGADGPFQLSELLKAALDYGFDLTWYNNYIETIKNITANEIQHLAVKYLETDSFTRLVVGKQQTENNTNERKE
ncbi:MAG: insulinase family protein [Clostridia bacterium]|nr:insulinase family protein [Clostridia bacterium]